MKKTALEVFEDWAKEEVSYGEIHATIKMVNSKVNEVEVVQGGVIKRFREEVN